MHFTRTLVLLASALISGVVSDCDDWNGGHSYCRWYGDAPFCGTSPFSEGQWDGDQRLIATTQQYSVQELLNYHTIGIHCARDYGAGCGTGYKRLWCKSTPYLLAQEDSGPEGVVTEYVSAAVGAGGAKNPHQKGEVRVGIELV